MKMVFKKTFSTILMLSMLISGISTMKVMGVSPDEGMTEIQTLFTDELNYEPGALTAANCSNVWTGLNGNGFDPDMTTIKEENGNKYASITKNTTDNWSQGMKHAISSSIQSQVTSGKISLSADIMMTAENSGQIELTNSWNQNRPLLGFYGGAFMAHSSTDAYAQLTKTLIKGNTNEWYNVNLTVDCTNSVYEVRISQNDRLLYAESGLPLIDDTPGFGYLRFRNYNDGEFCVDNVKVKNVSTTGKENVISGVFDTLDGYESLTDGGVPTGSLTSTGWEAGAYGIKTASIPDDNGNKYINIPSDGSSIQYQIANSPVTTGLLRFSFSIKSTDYIGAFVEIHESDAYTSGGPVAMHIHGGNVYTRAGYWDTTGTKINMGSVATNEWFDVELTYNLDKNTYSIQLSRDGEVFSCLRDIIINKYNSAEAHTGGAKVLRFRDWSTNGGSTQVDNFEFEYLSSETEQDYIRTESKFDNYETIDAAITSPWAATFKGLGEVTLVDSDDGKAVSFPASDTNYGIQYNISNGFSSGEMVVNFSIKPKSTVGGALVTFPSGTGNVQGLVGLHMYKGSFITYSTGYNATNKKLGAITADEWYDVRISLDMDQKLYGIQIKHDGEVLYGLSNLDLIDYCDIENLMSNIGCIRFVDWGGDIGGAGYELDNFSLSYVNPENKKNFVVTEANFDSSESLGSVKGWTVGSGVAISDGKLSIPAGVTAQKPVSLIDSGKLEIEYTLNANGGKAEVLAVGTAGSFKLADFDGTTEDITVTNIVDLNNYKVTYYVTGENATTVDIADVTSGEALYNINAIKLASTGETAVTVDNLTVGYYVSKPTISDSAVTITDALGKIVEKGEVVNPGIRTIELNFDSELDLATVSEAISLTSESGDTPEYTLSTRAGKSVLSFNKALNPKDTYTLSVSIALENINGEALEEQYSYSFTTDEAAVFAEITAPTVGTKAIYAVSQLNAGDTLKLNADVANSTENDAGAIFVVGYYSDNVLNYIQTAEASFASGAITFDGTEIVVGDLSGIDEIKLFLWDSLKAVKPYCKNIVYEDYLTSLTIYGDGSSHTQGICTDNESGYLYQSGTSAIKKYDMKTGELIASVAGFPEGVHLGSLVYNPEDGMIYCPTIVYGENTGYVAIIDPAKLTELDMSRDTEGLIKLAYVPAPESKYAWNTGIDGATLAPLAGASRGSEKYLYVGRENPTFLAAHYSTLNVYDLDELKSNAIAYADDKISYKENKTLPTEIYYGYTGAREYGPQSLVYVPEMNGIFANFYQGNTPGMPNYSKCLFDLSKAPTEQALVGFTDVYAKILTFGDYGTTDVATGIKGTYEAEGTHGMTYLGNNYFYITTTNYNDNMDTSVQLYKFVDGEFVEVK